MTPKQEWLAAMRLKVMAVHKTSAEKAEPLLEQLDRMVTNMAGHANSRAGEGPMLKVDTVREMLLECYGWNCPHLPGLVLKLSRKNTEGMALDHVVPLNRGGTNDRHNLQIISRRANAIKEDMSPAGFEKLKDLLYDLSEMDRQSVERRLVATRAAVFGKGRR